MSVAGRCRRSCAAGGSGSSPTRSASRPEAAAVRRACGAKRSPSSPESGSLGTPGSSRAATSTCPLRCSRRSHGRCGSTGWSATTSTRWRASRSDRRTASAPRSPASVQKMLDQLSPYPAQVLNARFDVLAFNDAYCQGDPRHRRDPDRGAQPALADVRVARVALRLRRCASRSSCTWSRRTGPRRPTTWANRVGRT